MAIPVAKISATLLAFAEPLLGSAPESLTWEEVEGALTLAWTVWNAAVMDATRENPQFLAEMRKLVAQEYPIAQMVEGLITRKQTQFGHNLRLLGEYRILKRAGEWRLRPPRARKNELAWTTLEELTTAVAAFVNPVLAGKNGTWRPAKWQWF